VTALVGRGRRPRRRRRATWAATLASASIHVRHEGPTTWTEVGDLHRCPVAAGPGSWG